MVRARRALQKLAIGLLACSMTLTIASFTWTFDAAAEGPGFGPYHDLTGADLTKPPVVSDSGNPATKEPVKKPPVAQEPAAPVVTPAPATPAPAPPPPAPAPAPPVNNPAPAPPVNNPPPVSAPAPVAAPAAVSAPAAAPRPATGTMPNALPATGGGYAALTAIIQGRLAVQMAAFTLLLLGLLSMGGSTLAGRRAGR